MDLKTRQHKDIKGTTTDTEMRRLK